MDSQLENKLYERFPTCGRCVAKNTTAGKQKQNKRRKPPRRASDVTVVKR